MPPPTTITISAPTRTPSTPMPPPPLLSAICVLRSVVSRRQSPLEDFVPVLPCPSLQSEEITPLATHVVVGDGRLAGGAAEQIGAILDRVLRARRQGHQAIQHGAVFRAGGIELRLAVDAV